IIRSEAISAAVIRNLHLVTDPEFGGAGPGFFRGLFNRALMVAPQSQADLEQKAQSAFRARLYSQRVGTTYVIEIGFVSNNPQRAAEVANATADAYITDQLEAKYEATRRAGTWLQDRIQELRQEASSAENAVLDFKKAHNIVDTGGRLIGEQQM